METLTRENAHRVTMVRRKDAPESAPVAFHYRGLRFGYCSYAHLIGDKAQEQRLLPTDFPNWEVVEVAHPGYLEEYFKSACSSFNCSSHNPDERGESLIADYEKMLHEDLSDMPQEQHERYISNFKQHISNIISANSRCASAMVVGPAGFNSSRNEKHLNAYMNAVDNFTKWRERAHNAISKAIEAAKPEEQRFEEAWVKVKSDIDDTALHLIGIDEGRVAGYRQLFVSNLYGRITTHANNGNVEMVDRAIAHIREWNSKMKKPIFTERHSIFKLPQIVRTIVQKREEAANRENKEAEFDGGKVVYNYEENRIQILFKGMPDNNMRTNLKREAFKWSPRNQAWQRQLTSNAVCATERVLNIKLRSV